MRLTKVAALAGLVAAVALLAIFPVEGAFATYPGADGVLGFASTGNLGAVTTNNGAQILYQAQPASSPPSSFHNIANMTTTAGGTDASPFYSADGKWSYFSSNATSSTGDFAVYSLPAGVSPGAGADARIELSLGPPGGPATEVGNDFVPTVTPDGGAVLFVRDSDPPVVSHPVIMEVPVANGAPTAVPSVCYDPQTTIFSPSSVHNPPALPDGRLGDSSRVEVDPVNGHQFVYEDSTGQLHLVTWPNGLCNATSATDQTITSTSVVPAASAGSNFGFEYFENPDWAPDGSALIMDSNAFAGLFPSGHSVLARMAMTPAVGTPANLWSAAATLTCATGSGTSAIGQGNEYQPVFSPFNDSLAFTETSCSGGSEVEFIDPNMGAGYQASNATTFDNGQSVTNYTNSATACSPAHGFQKGKCTGIDSEPAWQPIPGPGAVLPEAPAAILLPLAGIGVAGLAFALSRRGRRSRARSKDA
jgi:hypothetical protein